MTLRLPQIDNSESLYPIIMMNFYDNKVNDLARLRVRDKFYSVSIKTPLLHY